MDKSWMDGIAKSYTNWLNDVPSDDISNKDTDPIPVVASHHVFHPSYDLCARINSFIKNTNTLLTLKIKQLSQPSRVLHMYPSTENRGGLYVYCDDMKIGKCLVEIDALHEFRLELLKPSFQICSRINALLNTTTVKIMVSVPISTIPAKVYSIKPENDIFLVRCDVVGIGTVDTNIQNAKKLWLYLN